MSAEIVEGEVKESGLTSFSVLKCYLQKHIIIL